MPVATVQELALLVQGIAQGEVDQEISGAAPLHEAQPGQITFIDGEQKLKELEKCQASAVIVPESVTLDHPPSAWITVKDPFEALVTIAGHLKGKTQYKPHGIDPKAVVHPSAVIGKDCSIHAYAVIGPKCVLGDRCCVHPGAIVGENCKVGDDVTLHPHSVLYDDTILGNRVIIHAGAVIGADGFGYRFHNGQHNKIPQLGQTVIADDVEIGACSAIDRGTFGSTTIGEGTKIDNLVQIGHNCRIGPHNVIAGQVGIAGSSTTGAYVVLAGQVGIADHITIGDGAAVGAQSGLMHHIPAGEKWWGTPATKERDQKRLLLQLRKLADMQKELKALRSEVTRLNNARDEAA